MRKIFFSFLKYGFVVLVVTTLIGSVVGAVLFLYFSRGLPNIITTNDYKPFAVTKILGKGDVVVGEFFEERRYVVPLESIPEVVIKAFVAAEDDRFFEHQGIDLQGIVRAAIANFKAGKIVQGGSTITQQVAKSLLLTPERSLFRKIKEAILANRMENNLTKKQILFLYLNQIYLGQGAYGVAAAAKVFFNKDLEVLTLAEAALLAGLPQAPSKYSPLTNPKRAKERQAYVLRRLYEDGAIDQKKMEQALREQLKIYLPQDVNERYAPYFVEHIRKYLLDKYGMGLLYKAGLTIRTSLDPNLSLVATKAVQEGLRTLDKKQGYRGPLGRNKTQKEIQAALEEATEFNLMKKYPYKVILPDGSHAQDLKDRMSPDKQESDAFEEGGVYKGVVLGVDSKKKEVHVKLGFLKGVLPLDKMQWAHDVVLTKGDSILVRILNKSEQKITLSLEQDPQAQGALLSIDLQTGAVLSMVGGFDFKQSEFNRAIQAERQPGSAYKPIIYAAAIDKGYTPATIIQDSPLVLSAGENEKWKPDNYEEKFYGDTTFRSALIRSRNIPTIKIVQDIQVSYLIEYSKRLGISKNLTPDLSIALGTAGVSLLDLVQVYAIFPRGGRQVKPVFINKIFDRNEKILEEIFSTPFPPIVSSPQVLPPKPVQVAGELQAERLSGNEQELSAEAKNETRGVWHHDPMDPNRVMDARTAYVMTHLMNEVATIGTGAEAKNLGRVAAGKTGTTNDNLDAWFLGFTPHVLTGVWVGFDAQKSLGSRVTGAYVALPIWLEYMKEAVKPHPNTDFIPPKGVAFTFIDSKTGRTVSANKPNAIREVFIEGTEPGRIFPTYLQNSENNTNQKPTVVPDTPGDDFYKEDIQ